MPTPYAAPRASGSEPHRPRLVRSRAGLVAGVCTGLAGHLGVSVRVVRLIMIGLAVAGGAGLAAYLFLWALTPLDDESTPASSGTAGRGLSVDNRAGLQIAAGTLIVVGGAALLAPTLGLNLRSTLLIPLIIIAIGAIVAWTQLDDVRRAQWLGAGEAARSWGWVRLALGIAVVAVGLVVLVPGGASLTLMRDVGLATLAVLAGIVILAAPIVVRLWGDLRREQEQRARATERADIAAHLHDSVLQTLALIQRRAGDAAAVTQLARAQERELRSWLYAAPAPGEATLATVVGSVVAEVEDLSGVPIESVVTGDRPLDGAGQAFSRALREAVFNAVRHGAVPVSVYVEIGDDGVRGYIRDHGTGFDVDAIPDDRHGVRESIVDRMTRHGGTATIRRRDPGVEIELTLPATTGDGS